MFKDLIAYKKYDWFTKKFKSNTLIETGTFWGESTLIFSQFHDEVITCEIDLNNVETSINRFKSNGFKCTQSFFTKTYNYKVFKFVKNNKKIWLVNGSSQNVLDSIFLGELNHNFSSPYTFFLDAHGGSNYWPILDELNMILKYHLVDSKIIIHDFKVPGFDDWGYDKYDGQDLDYDYVKDFLFKINPKFLSFFPDKVANGVHGVGILYVIPNDEIDFEDYLKLNRGNPPIKINKSFFTKNEFDKTKNNFHSYIKKNNIL